MNWKRLKIREFTDVTTGGTPSTQKDEYWVNGTIPWLRSGELKDCRIYSSEKRITTSGLRDSAAQIMPPKTVLVALTGATTGQTAILEFEACANQSVTGILPSKVHHPEYLFYYLQSIRKHIKSKSYGVAQPHISQSFVKDIEVILPPLPIQVQIAEVLERADVALEKRRQANLLVEQLLQSAFWEMFGDPATNPNRFPLVKIDDIVSEVKDGPHVSPEYVRDGIPILSTRNIRPGKLILEDMKYVSHSNYEYLTRYFKPKIGDVLLTKGGTTGFAKVVDFDWPFCVWVHIAVLRPKNTIHPRYLETALNSEFCYKQSQRYTHGIANRDLGLKRIVKIELLLPPMELQEKYVDISIKAESLRAMQRESEKELENLFGSLMQKAFRGELV